MRKPSTRYSAEVVKLICDAIEDTGRDSDGFAAGGITKVTFYMWQREKPEFKAAVDAAKKAWNESSLPMLRKFARGGLRRTLQAVAEGREIITTTTVSGVGPEGDVELETIQRKPAMVPVSQAFSYVMGREIDLVSWLRQGVNLEIFPRAFVEDLISDIDEVTDRVRSAVEGRIAVREKPGRSARVDPSIAIAAALGLSHPTPVPKTVDGGQVKAKDLGEVTADRG